MGLRLADIRIATKISIACLVSLTGLAMFAGLAVFHAWSESNAARAVLSATDLAESASLAIHELQKERGMSSGFVASKGQQFSAELPPQRQSADSRIKSFQDVAAAFTTGSVPGAMAASIDAALAEIRQIDPLRKTISGLTVPAGEAAAP